LLWAFKRWRVASTPTLRLIPNILDSSLEFNFVNLGGIQGKQLGLAIRREFIDDRILKSDLNRQTLRHGPGPCKQLTQGGRLGQQTVLGLLSSGPGKVNQDSSGLGCQARSLHNECGLIHGGEILKAQGEPEPIQERTVLLTHPGKVTAITVTIRIVCGKECNVRGHGDSCPGLGNGQSPMHRTLCQGVEDANGLRSGKPDFIERISAPGCWMARVMMPSAHTTSPPAMVLAPIKSARSRASSKLTLTNLRLESCRKLSDELGLARPSFTRQPSVMRERIIKGNQGLMQVGRVENVIVNQGRGFRIRPKPDLKITKIDPVISGTGKQIPGTFKSEAGQTGGNLRQDLDLSRLFKRGKDTLDLGPDRLADQAGVGRLDPGKLGLNITFGLLDCGLSLEFDRLTKVMESVLDVGKSLIKAGIRPSDWCGLSHLNLVDQPPAPGQGFSVGDDSVGQDTDRIFLSVNALGNTFCRNGNPDQLIAGEVGTA
jgi:hypothetical protein